MAGIKISALPAAASAVGTDVFPADQSGPITRKISLSQIATLFNTNFVQLSPTGNQVITSGNLTLQTGGLAASFVTAGNISISGNTVTPTNIGGKIYFQNNGSTQYIFGNSGGVAPTGTISTIINVGDPGNVGAYSLFRTYNNSNNGGSLIALSRSRSTSINTFVVVQAADYLGKINFAADTGAAFNTRSSISSQATTIGSFVGSNLVFWTSSTAAEQNNIVLTLGDDKSATFTGIITGQTTFTAKCPNTSLGSLSLTAVNNTGNYANVLTNSSTTAARTWTLPDASGTLALTTTTGGLTPISVSGTTQALSSGNAYIFNNAGATTGTLPTSGSSAIGDLIKIKGRSSAPWIIQANTGQIITNRNVQSSTSGTATSSLGSDSIQLMYVAANEWSIDWSNSSLITLA